MKVRPALALLITLLIAYVFARMVGACWYILADPIASRFWWLGVAALVVSALLSVFILVYIWSPDSYRNGKAKDHRHR